MSISLRLLLTLLVLSVVSGCSTIYRPAGWFIYDYSEEYAVPYSMKTSDLDMACTMTSAMMPVLMSFTELTYVPNRNAVVMNMLMGSCAEMQASDEVLAYTRAYKNQNINEAKDTRIREQQALALAAARQYTAYSYMVAEFGEPGDKCPKLSKHEEMYWVMGNLAGMQAVMSDLRSQSVVGVPKDIAMKAVRGMQCVDNERWWGLPEALQAGMWIMMPDTAPSGVDPWARMAQAQQLATTAGVRLAHTIAVVIADGSGHHERLRQAIKLHGDSVKAQPSNPRYALIDAMSTRQIRAVSDRLWTEATGSRTPVGGLGTFWDDQPKAATTTINIDDLLGD